MQWSDFDWGQLRTRGMIPSLLAFMEARRVCEVGVRDGYFFKTILSGEFVRSAWAVDIWDDYFVSSQNDIGTPRERVREAYERFVETYKKDKRVKVLKMDSAVAHEHINEELDFVYIDGDHTYFAVKRDLNNFWDKLRVGGVLAGHDYENLYFRGHEFRVKTAVDEFVAEHNLSLHVTNEPRFKSFFIVKTT